MLKELIAPLGVVRLATRRHCQAHARPKVEAVRLWPWYLPHLQSEGALVIEALMDTVPGVRVENRPDPLSPGSSDTAGESHLFLGSGGYQLHGGFGSKTFLHAETPEEAEALRRLYRASWIELCRFRQKWTR